MLRKVVSETMLFLLLLGMLTLTLNIQPVKASETIYIRADGSIDPPDARISTLDNVTYTLADNITSSGDGIIVERDNIIIDGNGYALQGTESGTGISLSERSNVTIENLEIKMFNHGVYLYSSSNNSISESSMTNSGFGIWLSYSSFNSIVGNNITANMWFGIGVYWFSNYNTISENNITASGGSGVGSGIRLDCSSNNTISRNNIINNRNGVVVALSSDNSISGNIIRANNWDGENSHGISLGNSDYNNIFGNDVINNGYGVSVVHSSTNRIFHNNFIDNLDQASTWYTNSVNAWDDGYPSGGNYWSDYAGVDLHSGSNQDQPGSDGIGDTPNYIDENNQDNYPLMNLWGLVAGKLEIAEPTNESIISGSVRIDLSIENTGCDVEFLQGDSSNRIDLEIEYFSTGGEIHSWGIILWSTSQGGLALHPREKYTRTVIFDPSEYEEAVPPDFVGNAPYGQAIIRLVHWKQTAEGYDHGEFGVAEMKVELILNASIDIHPKTLNLRSQSKWITAYIELPEDYNVSDIDVSTILLNNTISAELELTTIGDYDSDGIPDLMVRFNRTMVAEYIRSKSIRTGNVTLTIRFHTLTCIMYEGADTITISDMIGDVNCDGKVGINDIVMAAASYGSTEESPNYNPNANFAQPYEVIDILDLVTIASHYGEENP